MSEVSKPLNFIEKIIENDLNTGKHDRIQTRFPPLSLMVIYILVMQNQSS